MKHSGPDTTPAVATHCTRCAAPTIRALDEGLDTQCDPHLLTLADEIRAHLDSRPTYQLIRYHDGHLELAIRTASRIAHTPAAHVVARHRCQRPPIPWREATWLPAAVPIDLRVASRTVGDAPPF